MRLKGVVYFEIIMTVLVSFFPIHLNTYVMSLLPVEIFLILECGDRLKTSESDVYRRQILTTKVDPRAVKVKA